MNSSQFPGAEQLRALPAMLRPRLGRPIALERTQRFARPLQAGHRIARAGIPQQFFQRAQDLGLFFSTAFRPPPGTRTRLIVLRSRRCTSARPRLIVTRLSPVISCNSWMLPRPHWRASSPTKRRRCFSSSPATKRLIARCSFAIALCGCRWHVSQIHEWASARCLRSMSLIPYRVGRNGLIIKRTSYF